MLFLDKVRRSRTARSHVTPLQQAMPYTHKSSIIARGPQAHGPLSSIPSVARDLQTEQMRLFAPPGMACVGCTPVAKNGRLQRLCFPNRLSWQESGPYSRFAGRKRGLTAEICCKPPILASTNAVSPRFLPFGPARAPEEMCCTLVLRQPSGIPRFPRGKCGTRDCLHTVPGEVCGTLGSLQPRAPAHFPRDHVLGDRVLGIAHFPVPGRGKKWALTADSVAKNAGLQ